MPRPLSVKGYSTGCFSCRERKVKCDERRPGCRRCERRDQPCPGYRDLTQVVFRSMNGILEHKHDRTRHAFRAFDAGSSSKSRSFSPESAGSSGSELLLLQPSNDWEEQSLVHFFHHFVLQPTSSIHGHLDFLPDLMLQNPDNLALKHALYAVSMAHLGNMTSLAELPIKAQRHYGTALRTVAAALNDPAAAKNECFVSAILLIQLYELICGLQTRAANPHEQGLVQILRVRESKQPTRALNESLSFLIKTRRRIIELDGLQQSLNDSDSEAKRPVGPAANNQIYRILGQSSQKSRHLKLLTAMHAQGAALEQTEVVDALHGALAVHAQQSTMKSSITRSLRLHSLIMPRTPDSPAPQYPRKYLIFQDVRHGAKLISFWCSQIHLLQNIQQYIDEFNLHYVSANPVHSTSEQRHRELMAAVDNICASSPFLLGDLDSNGRILLKADSKALGAHFLLYGLYTCIDVPGLSAQQRTWILDRLAQIGHLKGIRQALTCRRRWLREHPEFQYSRAVAPVA